MPFNEYFENKICVVTGAASGIGFALSEALLKVDAVVVMADRDTETDGDLCRVEERQASTLGLADLLDRRLAVARGLHLSVGCPCHVSAAFLLWRPKILCREPLRCAR